MSEEHAVNVGELRSRGVVKLKGNDVYALWVKTACCNLSSRQLRMLADISERYGKGFLLFTTRQIPIIPFVHLGDVEAVQGELARVDMVLDRCGPTVRNVNVCYDDGICPQAVLNSLSLGEKLDHFFRVPMAHKVKLGVAGCRKDCIDSRVLTDIGFVAAETDGVRGYDVYVGGKLGLNPFIGVKMAAGLSDSECVRLVQNYFELMNTRGKKDERAAELVRRLGADTVRHALQRDLQRDPGVNPIPCSTKSSSNHTQTAIVRVRATSGEVTAPHLRKIADISDKYGRGFVHFAVRGAPEIPCVEEQHVGAVREELAAAGLEVLEDGIDNLQSCFGGYCTENNADPQALLGRIDGLVRELRIDRTDIRISASGCPSSCAIAHLSDIGFYGAVKAAIDPAKCNGCELCVPVCKRHAIQITNGVATITEAECGHCGVCITVCPFNAIEEKQRGFTALIGGCGGEKPRLGDVLAEFLAEDEALQLARQCLTVLAEKQTDAATLIDRVGVDGFQKLLSQTRTTGAVTRG